MEDKVTLSYAKPPISTDDHEFLELFNIVDHPLLKMNLQGELDAIKVYHSFT